MRKFFIFAIFIANCFGMDLLENALKTSEQNKSEIIKIDYNTSTTYNDINLTNKPIKIFKKISQGELIDENSTLAKGDWQGYYFGILPCFTCKGIATWLHLKMVDNRGEYEMREKFLGIKNRYSLGGIGWEDNGSIVKLLTKNNKKKFHIIDKNLDLLDKISIQNLTLEKLDTFDTQNSVFLVNPKTLLPGKSHGKTIVRFKGLINYNDLTQNGYKSKKISLLLHCEDKKYELSRVSYYKKRYAMGDFIRPNENTRGLFDTDNSQLILKASQKYCP